MTAASINQALVALTQSLGERTATCNKHGEYVSRGAKFNTGKGREVWTSCPACSKEQEGEARKQNEAAAASARQAELEKMLAQTAIPQRFLDRTFDNWRAETEQQQHVLRVCQEYADKFSSHHASGFSLVFSGAAGTGKSHLAAAILKAILPRHVGVYLTFMGMIRLIRETWHPSSQRRESEVLAELGSIPLLVLDEIGVQYGTEAEHTLLFEVMDRRYRDMKPTILLTNQNKDGFKHFVGDRVFDRLRETARWVTFDWSSHRAKAREERGGG